MNPYSHGKRYEIGLDLFVKGFAKDHLSRAYMGLTNTRETDRLILECATLPEMDEEYNPGEPMDEGIYEAVTVRRFSQTDSRMKALARVFSKFLPETISPAAAIIGKPKKTGLFASVTAQIPFSDGQAVTIVFHSPEGDAKKIGPDDEIIAYRWLLNKRDITHVVSPEGEADVSLEEVGKRISQLVAKNSDRFQKSQADVKAQNEQLDALKTDSDKLSKENMDLMNDLKDQQDAAAAAQAKLDRTRGLLEKQQNINADLENQLAALQAKSNSDEAARKVAEETAAKQAADDAALAAQKAADEAGVPVDNPNSVQQEPVIENPVPSVDLNADTSGASPDETTVVYQSEPVVAEITQPDITPPADDLVLPEPDTPEPPPVVENQDPAPPEAASETDFMETLRLSADSPDQLRPVDVYRVMTDAQQRGYADAFAAWLLLKDIQPRTKEKVQEYLAPVIPPEAAEPPAVTVANDIISGKYDSLPLKEILNLSEPIWDLDENTYHDLMSQADAYLTKITKERAMAA